MKAIRFSLIFLALAVCVSVVIFFLSNPQSEQSLSKQWSSRLSDEVGVLEAEIEEVKKTGKIETGQLADHHALFIFQVDSLVNWSTHHYLPPASLLTDSVPVQFVTTAYGDFIAVQKKQSDRTIIGLLLLHRNYHIDNQYLPPISNEKIFTEKIRAVEPSAEDGISLQYRQEVLCKVFIAENENVLHPHRLFIFFLLLVAFVVFAVSIVTYRVRSRDAQFLTLLVFFLSLRGALVLLDWPAAWGRSDLFDPVNFASSTLSASLGDLLLNLVLLLILGVFLYRHYASMQVVKTYLSSPRKNVASVAVAWLYLMVVLFPFVVVQTLINNSSIEVSLLDSLSVTSLRGVAWACIIIAGCCSFFFAHVLLRLFSSHARWYWVLVAAAVFFVGLNLITEQPFVPSLVVGIVFSVVVIVGRLIRANRQFNYTTFMYGFTAIVCWSLQVSYAVLFYEEKRGIREQVHFAETYLSGRDYLGEYLLQDVAEKVASDPFVQARIANPFFSKQAIRQKINQIFLPVYFNKYNCEVLIFNTAGEPENNSNSRLFSEWINLYNQLAYRTSYEAVYFMDSPGGQSTKSYVVVIPVLRASTVRGYVILQLNLKNKIPQNVYPELLVQSRFILPRIVDDVSYAIVEDDSLLHTSGAYAYSPSLIGRLKNEDVVYANNFRHVLASFSEGAGSVVSLPVKNFVQQASVFSFFLLQGLFVLLLVTILITAGNRREGRSVNFATRVQLILTIAVLLPLLLISAIMLGIINTTYIRQTEAEFKAKSNLLGEQLITRAPTDTVGISDDLFNQRVLSAGLDASLFNESGRLVYTNQPQVYSNFLMAGVINPAARGLIDRGELAFVLREQAGSLKYFVSYKTITVNNRQWVLAVPFFRADRFLEDAQVNTLANILTVFGFVFIGLLLLSYIVSRWLTQPLQYLTSSLKRISLTNTNKRLSWNSDDEFGLMVKEYNAMLEKLEESKRQLELSQREKAWREIAQQVAHEIKNPLTPMKLTVQQLERTAQQPLDNERLRNALRTLDNQIEILNGIATSFSAFAKMPDPKSERVEVAQLVQEVVSLYASSGAVYVDVQSYPVINADKELLKRIVTNLVLNALQAERAEEPIQVKVVVAKESQRCVIQCIDNGRGIERELAEKIFLPHFTTKQSGSGLGLAIARQGVEKMEGTINFQSEPGKGTTFTLEFPALNL